MHGGTPPVRLGDRKALPVGRRPRLDVCPEPPTGCGLAGWHASDCPIEHPPICDTCNGTRYVEPVGGYEPGEPGDLCPTCRPGAPQ